MAKFRPADPPLSAKRDRRPKQSRGSRATRKGAAADDSRGALLEAVVVGDADSTVDKDRHSKHSKNTRRTDANQVLTLDLDDDDHVLRHVRAPTPVAVPLHIGACIPIGKIVTSDGRELPYYQDIPEYVLRPLPGFEHVSGPVQDTPTASKKPSNTRSEPNRGRKQSRPRSVASVQQFSRTRLESQSPIRGHAYFVSRDAVGRSNARQPSRKRRRSPAARNDRQREAELSDDSANDEDEKGQKVYRAKTDPSYQFYIGNFDDLKRFFQRRFDEFTTRPLRPIVTTWVKLLEPRRLGGYGPYHRQLPGERPFGETPPWWPKDVPYNEPSHLPKHALQALAVDLMLQHRDIDKVKRKGPWVAKLRQSAEYAVEITPPENFCASKSPEYSERMKRRALDVILPSLFGIAQAYEDHVSQYALCDGGPDPGTGSWHTWEPLARAPRHIKKIKREASPALPVSQGTTDDVSNNSGDDTEVDDFASEAFLRRERVRARKAKAQRASNKDPSKPSPQQTPTEAPLMTGSRRAQSEISARLIQTLTSNSFDSCMDSLQLGESISVDADVKPPYPSGFQPQRIVNTLGPMGSPDQFHAQQSLISAQEFHSQGPAGPYPTSYQSAFHDPSTAGMMAPLPLFANVPYTQGVDAFIGTPMGSTPDATGYQSPYINSGYSHGSFHSLPTGPNEHHEAKHFGL